MNFFKKLIQKPRIVALLALIFAAIIWLPNASSLFSQPESNYISEKIIAPKGLLIANRYINFWTNPELRKLELDKMRSRNAEWDFMGRCFFVWSLGNMALREPNRAKTILPIMDSIIDETLSLEKKYGMYFFLMPYAKILPFKQKPERSIFLDGEISLMLAIRRLVEEKKEYKELLRSKIETMVSRMEVNPVLCAESYPDECWLFCNSIALAAIKIGDFLDHTDNSEFLKNWIKSAKENLIDKKTGILVSAFDLSGKSISDGPEGSTIWLVSHCLKIIDQEFAEDQYLKAKKHLQSSFLGFGYAYEWPGGVGHDDVDSGPIIPIINLSAGSTGLAFLGAASFNDREYLAQLYKSLELGAFPIKTKDEIKYCASNAVGDSVLLYSITQGPAWDKILKGEKNEN